MAKICIIPKPGKNKYISPESFWPISLLSTLGKIFKRIIHIRTNKVNHSCLPRYKKSLLLRLAHINSGGSN
jgi:hypothetical protein